MSDSERSSDRPARNPFEPSFEQLPETLPIFPLSGVLLLPGGKLPLNVFEPRYLAMVMDALAGHRMIGMVQPQQPGGYAGDEVEAFFQNRLDTGRHPYYATIEALRVSAHFYLRRDGRLVQFVPVHERAWHAGLSVYRARDACNDFAVGIELEGSDAEPYDERQYPVLAALIVALRRAYPTLAEDALAGHSYIAPARKTDPGPHFDWERLRRTLADLPAPAQAGG